MKEIKILIDDTDGNEVCTLKVSERIETKTVINCLCSALVNVIMKKTGANEVKASRQAAVIFAGIAAKEAEKPGDKWKH